MNILYILGNGFDKAQGLATSYPEFYEYLKQQVNEESHALLQRMVNDIAFDKTLWSDMEEALGKFTSQSQSPKEFDDFYFKLSDYLSEYLIKETENFNPTNEYKKKIEQAFFSPAIGLAEADLRYYNSITSQLIVKNPYINIVTLNYTDIVEKLFNLPKESEFGGIIRGITHIHGKLSTFDIIIGVDNPQQIKNVMFRDNDAINEIFVKQQSNIAMKTLRHENFQELIENADVIVLYGSSLGVTDERWWKMIGQKITENPNLILIYHAFDEEWIRENRRQRLKRYEDKHREKLLQSLHIQGDENMKNRIFISLCSKQFTPSTPEEVNARTKQIITPRPYVPIYKGTDI